MGTIDKILLLMQNDNIEQKTLAEAIGVRKQAITEWKNGTTKSYLKYINKIADFFGVSVDYLLNDSEYTTGTELAKLLFNISKQLNVPYDTLEQIFWSKNSKIPKDITPDGTLALNEKNLLDFFQYYFNTVQSDTPTTSTQEQKDEFAEILQDFTPEEREQVRNYIKFIKSQRKK